MRRKEGVSKVDRKCNIEIRVRLGVQSILNIIEERQLSWYGHPSRIYDNKTDMHTWLERKHKNKNN